jgi:hypothetical protein
MLPECVLRLFALLRVTVIDSRKTNFKIVILSGTKNLSGILGENFGGKLRQEKD